MPAITENSKLGTCVYSPSPIDAQTGASYESRMEAVDEFQDHHRTKMLDIARCKFTLSYFEVLIRLALLRIVYIIKYHGAKNSEKADFGLSISTVFECLVCILHAVKWLGGSGDNGINGFSDQAMIQSKVGASHRHSAAKIWR